MLKHKQALITIAVTLGAAGLGFIAFTIFSKNLSDTTAQHVERQQQQLVAVASSEVERYFYDIQKRLETIALMPDVRDAQRSEDCNAKLQKLVEANSRELNNLGRVGKDGTFVCAVNRTIIGEPVSKYGDYFQKIATHPEHKPAMSRLILPTGSASPVVAVHVPVYDSRGEFNGTIGGAVYFDELQQRILAGTKLSKNTVLALYDENLDVLYNPDPLVRGKNLDSPDVKELYTPRSAVDAFITQTKEKTPEGKLDYSLHNIPQHAVYKTAHVIDRRWTVVVAVPTNDLQEFSEPSTAKNIFIGTLITLIAVVALAAYALQTFRTHKQTK